MYLIHEQYVDIVCAMCMCCTGWWIVFIAYNDCYIAAKNNNLLNHVHK